MSDGAGERGPRYTLSTAAQLAKLPLDLLLDLASRGKLEVTFAATGPITESFWARPGWPYPEALVGYPPRLVAVQEPEWSECNRRFAGGGYRLVPIERGAGWELPLSVLLSGGTAMVFECKLPGAGPDEPILCWKDEPGEIALGDLWVTEQELMRVREDPLSAQSLASPKRRAKPPRKKGPAATHDVMARRTASAQAASMWRTNPKRTIKDVIMDLQVLNHKGVRYSEKAYRGWIEDFCPIPTGKRGGRPRKT